MWQPKGIQYTLKDIADQTGSVNNEPRIKHRFPSSSRMRTKKSSADRLLLPGLDIENTRARNPKLEFVMALLASKHWFGFDLDDTRHEFRKASAYVSRSVFKTIQAIRPESTKTVEELEATYREVLRSKTATAFTDGRSSENYRREGFSHLLDNHGYESSSESLEKLLTVYQTSLRAALTLKPRALRLLEKLKASSRAVIVVTEGPQDAQEWTVSELGLKPFIDIFVTTNDIGKSKVDGLFPAVLEKHNIASGDMVYVGDNQQRVIPPSTSSRD